VKIYDPYFSSNELRILKAIPYGTRVVILTSWKAQSGIPLGNETDLKDAYRRAWKKIANQEPSLVRVYVLGIEPGDDDAGESPLHQRYYITGNGTAVELGSSLSGIGKKDTSTVSQK
jgi:hypothetical protein